MNRGSQQQVLEDSEATSSVMEGELAWVEWFCRLPHNKNFYVEVDDDYIQDDFNLTGLSAICPHYEKALDIILDADEASESDSGSETIYEAAAARLFGLIHARFIITAQGINMMLKKYEDRVYGVCPNSKCRDQPVMPIGRSDQPDQEATFVYCPRCREIYRPVSSRLAHVDGAYFGTTFAPLFFMQNPTIYNAPNSPDYYIPKICGFKVSPEVRTLRDEDSTTGRTIGGAAQATEQTGPVGGAVSIVAAGARGQ